MKIFKTELEKRIATKFNEIDFKIKNSFEIVKEGTDKTENSVEAMKSYLKKKEKQDNYAREKDNKLRAKFRKDVNEFNQKTKQLSEAFEKVRIMKQNIVTIQDIGQIEEDIRTGFKQDLEEIKDKIKSLNQTIADFDKEFDDVEKRINSFEKQVEKEIEKQNKKQEKINNHQEKKNNKPKKNSKPKKKSKNRIKKVFLKVFRKG